MKRLTMTLVTGLALVAISTGIATARIINIPADYSTIQAGIDSSINGDTVLVQPGIYYENINYDAHNIQLVSAYLFSNDSINVINTIIDGNSVGPIVSIENGETDEAKLIGFSLRNGAGTYAGGLECYNSSPGIYHNRIYSCFAEDGGAAIDCFMAEPEIAGNLIFNDSSGYGSGAVSCNGSRPILRDNRIFDNQTIGIYCRNHTTANIDSNIIENNAGYGIFTFHATPVIRSNIIMNNSSGIAGEYADEQIIGNLIYANNNYGINLSWSNPVIRQNTVVRHLNNAGIALISCSAEITNCIIWGNSLDIAGRDYAVISYCDLQSYLAGEGNISSNPIFVDPVSENYNICQESPCLDSGDPLFHDPDGSCSDMGVFYANHAECGGGNFWNVSINGNDSTGDGSFSSPFRTIQHAIDVSFHGDTVLAQNGEYYENVNFEGRNVLLISNYFYSGDTIDLSGTILNGDSAGTVVTFANNESAPAGVVGFTIRYGSDSGIKCINSSPKIKNNIITRNYAGQGGGIFCSYSRPQIIDNVISHNKAYQDYARGGGIYNDRSQSIIRRNLIADNICTNNNGNPTDGGGILISIVGGIIPLIENNIILGNISIRGAGAWVVGDYNEIYFNNNIFRGNIADDGGAVYLLRAKGVFTNCIFRENHASDGNNIYYADSLPRIEYCDIHAWSGMGNIDVDPLFRDTLNGDFRLQSIDCGYQFNSPCIDAGHPDSVDAFLDCSWGLGNRRADIGAFGGGDTLLFTFVAGDDKEIPDNPILGQNYPNPFNGATTIKYLLPNDGHVTIDVFDILGRKILTLTDLDQKAGYQILVWDASNFPSGIYFYRLKSDTITMTRKCILLR